jgi:Na+/proline symporter
MSKGFKTISLIIIIILLGVLTYNIFSGANNPNTHANPISDEKERPFYVSLLISWLPMLSVFVFYILFLQVFKKIVNVGERIAVALEKNVGISKSYSEKQ